MNNKLVFRILLIAALLLGVAVVAWYAYNMGVAQGLAQNDQLPALPPGAFPYPYFGRPFFYGPFGFGFWGLRCLFPLLFFFLIFALLRGLWWRGHWYGGWRRGPWEQGVPPFFEEWHRQAHESKPPEG